MMKFLIAVLYCFAVASSENPFLKGSRLDETFECPFGFVFGPTGKCVPDCQRARTCPSYCELRLEVVNECPLCICTEVSLLKEANLCETVACPVRKECLPTGECFLYTYGPEVNCLNVPCELACKFGFKVENGCPICACREVSLLEEALFFFKEGESVKCPFGTTCGPTGEYEDTFLEEANLCETVECPVGTECGPTGECEVSLLKEANLCETVECPVGTECGPTGECVPFRSELEQNCPRVTCKFACEFGFKVKNGCPICACRRKPFKNCLFADVRCPVGEECDPFSGLCVPKCPTIRCMLACEHGFKIVNGCPICACERESFKFLAEESKEV